MVLSILFGLIIFILLFLVFWLLLNGIFLRGYGRLNDRRMAVRNGERLFNHSKRVVVIAAHPDDVEYYCGGTLAKLSRSGREVVVVICTKELDEDGAEIRRQEQEQAAKVLNYSRVIFLDFPDKGLNADSSLVKQLSSLFQRYKPDTLFTFDSFKQHPVYRHKDHKAAGEAAIKASSNYSFKRVYLFHSSAPNIWAEISKEDLELKIRAFGAHESQQIMGLPLARFGIRKIAENEGRKVDLKYAEVFRKL